MNVSESAIQNALRQFDTWLQDKGIIINDVFSGALDFKKTIQSRNIQLQEYNQAIDIAKRLELGTSVAKDFIDSFGENHQINSTLNHEFIDLNRSFGDLVKEGPKTAIEEKLMNAVDTFLSSQEKKQAVEQNLSIGEVIKQVDQSIQKSQEVIVQTMTREKQRERENDKSTVEQKPEKKMTSLGEEYGVLNEIVKSMRTALEEGRDKTMEKEQKQTKTQFKFETVSMNNVGENLKNMSKDPNHIQNKGQGLSR